MVGSILAMFALVIPPARAATLVVDDDGKATASNCGASTPAPNSIQAAITAAASGDTIKVCPGTYNENVVVNKANLTIDGAKAGVDARTRDQSGESTVKGTNVTAAVQLTADGVEWDGFTVRANPNGAGIYTAPTASGHEVINNVIKDNVFGLYLNSGPKFQNLVRRNRFTDNNRAGSASGNNIYSDQGLQRALVTTNKFEDHDNAAIVIADANTVQKQLTIERNKSSDDYTFLALFGTSNTAVAKNEVATDRENTGSAIFVGDDNSDVLIDGNTISSAGFSGIAIRGSGATAPTNVDIVNNSVREAYNNGIDVTADGAGEVEVRKNTVRKSRGSGLFFGNLTQGNLILDNSSRDNGALDCEDDSVAGTFVGTAGTANTWIDNTGRRDAPDGLCKN
jgi:nitrous oxidase accessory protein NosD